MNYSIVEALAVKAGHLALGHFERLSSIPVESKGHLDLVTVADREVERFLVEGLSKAYPDDGVFGEEGGDIVGTSGRVWVIDPIDGTFNFVRGSDQWAISIGLYDNGKPSFGVLYAPVGDMLFVGGKNVPATLNGKALKPRVGLDRSRAAAGVGFHPVIPVGERTRVMQFLQHDAQMALRCNGAATMSLIQVACGHVDGYIGLGDSSWDLMAALAILEQLNVFSTVDWSQVDLTTKFKYAVGTPEFLASVASVVPFGSALNMSLFGETAPKAADATV